MCWCAEAASVLSGAARKRLQKSEGGSWFVCAWERAVFLHYAIDPARLQPVVPLPLDVRAGRAYVSLVAFTMCGMRFMGGGRLGAVVCAPVATYRLLNLRTYVRGEAEPGIYFLAEWVPNRLAAFLAPRLYGLPYRLGRSHYEHAHEAGRVRGWVALGKGGEALRYRGVVDRGAGFGPCATGSLDAFLLERYSAFTMREGRLVRFRVWHEPWLQATLRVGVEDGALRSAAGAWWGHAALVGANYSPGVPMVWMGRPTRLRAASHARTHVRHQESCA